MGAAGSLLHLTRRLHRTRPSLAVTQTAVRTPLSGMNANLCPRPVTKTAPGLLGLGVILPLYVDTRSPGQRRLAWSFRPGVRCAACVQELGEVAFR